MTAIKDKKQYEILLKRVDALLDIVNEDTPTDDLNFIELDLLIGLVADYEEIHFPIGTPSLTEVIKLRMFEMGLTQKALSELLGISGSRLSELISGKSEPSIKVARILHSKLNIDTDIILGV